MSRITTRSHRRHRACRRIFIDGQRIRRRPSGLSLLEVMIATGILATSAFLLLSLIESGGTFGIKAEQHTEAMLLCQNRIAEMEWQTLEPSAGRAEVQPCPENEAWAFRTLVESIEEGRMLCVTVEVFPSDVMDEGQTAQLDSRKVAARLVRWYRVPSETLNESRVGNPPLRQGSQNRR